MKLPHHIVVSLYYAFVFVALTAVSHIVRVKYPIARESSYASLQWYVASTYNINKDLGIAKERETHPPMICILGESTK